MDIVQNNSDRKVVSAPRQKTMIDLIPEFLGQWCVKSSAKFPTVTAVSSRDWTPKDVLYGEYAAWCAGHKYCRHSNSRDFHRTMPHFGHEVFHTHHGDFYGVRLTGQVAWVEPASASAAARRSHE
jgi:Poxvirus D5 protein-like